MQFEKRKILKKYSLRLECFALEEIEIRKSKSVQASKMMAKKHCSVCLIPKDCEGEACVCVCVIQFKGEDDKL